MYPRHKCSEFRVCAFVFAVVVILSFGVPGSSCGETPTTKGDEPTIVLPFPPGARVVLLVYGIFSPNITYSFSFWVIDLDGIDCVILRYMMLSENVWHSMSVPATRENATRSYYESSFVGPKDGLDWKVFANDTLGRSTENGTIRYLPDAFAVDMKMVLIITIPVWLAFALDFLYRGRRQELSRLTAASLP